jgi:hypothetical protein
MSSIRDRSKMNERSVSLPRLTRANYRFINKKRSAPISVEAPLVDENKDKDKKDSEDSNLDMG